MATQAGEAANVVADSTSNVYATTAASEATTGTQSGVTGRKRVTRKPVDRRYLAGMSTASRAAYPMWNLNHSSPTGFTRYGCSPDMAAMSALPVTASVYIDCPGSGITLNGTISAGRVYFHGFIKGGVLSMPNATQVYIDDTTDTGSADSGNAITLPNDTAFCVRATSCSTSAPGPGQCSNAATGSATAHAQVIVRRGSLNGSGTSSLLRLCNTAARMQGGDIEERPEQPQAEHRRADHRVRPRAPATVRSLRAVSSTGHPPTPTAT